MNKGDMSHAKEYRREKRKERKKESSLSEHRK
jgi:hypothetical protein